MKHFSTFSGVEGIGQGLGEEWELVGVSEIDKYASLVLNYHYPKVKNYGDISTIDWSKVPDFDLLTGGSPCQNFSIAGKREGIVGSKSRLVWEFIRCLREKQPRYFIWENVKGVLSSRSGWDFANIITAFSESGYSLWWQVLNAKDFGVPQNRERIFVIGFREESPKEVFFEPKDNGLFKAEYEEHYGKFGGKATTPDGIANTITKSYGELSGDSTKIIQLNQPQHSNDRVYGTDGISPALNTMQGGNRQPFIVAQRGRNPENPKSRKSGLKTEQMLEPNLEGISNTITSVAKDNYVANYRHPMKGFKGYENISPSIKSSEGSGNQILLNGIRKLMPIECEALMGWPRDWTKFGRTEKGEIVEISDSQRYKMCGNGVVSPVIKVLAETLFI